MRSDPPTPIELLQIVTDHPLLQSMQAASLQDLKYQLEWIAIEVGQTLFAEGDQVDGFYFVIEGLLEVSRNQTDRDGSPDNDRIVLGSVGPGATIGEVQILTGGSRTVTVTALQPCGLIKLPKPAFDQFLASDAHVVSELRKTIMPRLYRDQLIDVLPTLFGELNEPMLQDLESKLTWMHVPRGKTLCRQGDPSGSFYIIISGRMQVLITDSSDNIRFVGEMSQGESIGEMGVITGDLRSATIVASRDTELIEFSKQEFDELTVRYPQFMRHLMKLLVTRLHGAERAERTERATRLSTNILLSPAADGAPLAEFAANLYTALEACGAGACLLLTSQLVDKILGYDGISQSTEGEPDDLRLRSWLSQQENQHRVILFQSDLQLTAWTKRCISSTDEVMFIAAANSEPGATAIVHEVQRQDTFQLTRRRHSLVLLHSPGVVRPTGTINWLQALNLIGDSTGRQILARHFHVRHDRDCQRVARFLLNVEVGLVLSGGGARGFAHVGCIRAMRELNISIDMIAGVSMGSLVAAAYAYDADRFECTIDQIKSQLKGTLLDITPPVVSLARGRRFDRRLQNLFQEVRIEDLWLPYFCVSSNLSLAELTVFESGRLWWAVRASGSLPGLTSPMISDNCLLFDGCLLDNLPMDVMRDRLGSAKVIAVDVVPPHDLTVRVPPLQSPSGWWLLWNRLNPFATKLDLPNIASILRRAAEVGSVYGRQRLIDQHLANLYLQPPVEDIAIGDFGKVEEAAQIGYEHCHKSLCDWQG